MRQSRFGNPIPLPAKSRQTVLVVDPTGGFRSDVAPTNLPPGYTPDAQNYLVREGMLEPRPMLVRRTTQTVRNSPILGGLEAVDVQGASYPFASHATNPVWYSGGSWSQLSYVSAAGVNEAPSNSNNSLWDMTQVYGYPLQDENLVIMASPSYQTLYCWQSGTTVYSTLTGAPRALAVAIFDNYVLAFNIQEGSNNYVQRVQWNDRGSVSSWTNANSLIGSIDLLDARGFGTRLLPQEDRCIAFTSREVWELRSVGLPSIFDYRAVDRTIGCPFPQTAADTPNGVIFLGNDYNLYLLPKGGGAAQPIGGAIHKTIRDTIDYPQRAWGRFNRLTNQYELHYAVRGGEAYPTRAFYLDLVGGAWMPQVFAQPLSYGWMGSLGTNSVGTTWAQAAAAGLRWADMTGTWGDQAGSAGVGPLAPYDGSSNGTIYYESSSATNDDGQTVTCRWRSHAIAGSDPAAQKTVTIIRVDYQAQSASSLTVRMSQDVGGSFDNGVEEALPASSVLSQARADVFSPSRYPMFEVEQERGRARLARFHVTYREQGR